MISGIYRYLEGDSVTIKEKYKTYFEKKYHLKGKCLIAKFYKNPGEDYTYLLNDQFGNINKIPKVDMDKCIESKDGLTHHTDDYKDCYFYYVNNVLVLEQDINKKNALIAFASAGYNLKHLPKELIIVKRRWEAANMQMYFSVSVKDKINPMILPRAILNTYYKKDKKKSAILIERKYLEDIQAGRVKQEKKKQEKLCKNCTKYDIECFKKSSEPACSDFIPRPTKDSNNSDILSLELLQKCATRINKIESDE